MSPRRAPLFALILLILLVCLLPQSYGSSTKSASRGKARDQVTDPPRRRGAVARKRPAVRGKRAAGQTRRRKRARARFYRRVWTESSYADSAAGDVPEGEDPVVREAALAALGPLNGSVVVVDPRNGRILSMVNQKLALSGAEQPCSTIKLPVALAALSEGLIARDTPVRLSRRRSMSLTEAMARSNNRYFEVLGRRLGFRKLRRYANQFGFGELAGYQIPGEQKGVFPRQPARRGGVSRMCSFGNEILVTPLQMAAFVSAVANGGTLYYLQYPDTPEEREKFQPRVKRQLKIQHRLPDLREGMVAAVDHGTGRRAAQPYDTVLGKTGTCSRGGANLGWFASYEGEREARLVVVVLLRGGYIIDGRQAAEVAGRVYGQLHERNYWAAAHPSQ